MNVELETDRSRCYVLWGYSSCASQTGNRWPLRTGRAGTASVWVKLDDVCSPVDMVLLQDDAFVCELPYVRGRTVWVPDLGVCPAQVVDLRTTRRP